MSSPHHDNCTCAACSSSTASSRSDPFGRAAQPEETTPHRETNSPAHRRIDSPSPGTARDAGPLAEHVRLLESAVLNSLDAIVITDAGGRDRSDPQIVFVNEAFTRLSGYSALEAIGRNPRFLQGHETKPEELARIRAAVTAGRPVAAELINYRKDGTPFHIEAHIMPIAGPGGVLTHWVAIHRDISERRKAEAERARFEGRLREMQKLESLGLLAGGIAHDFNNLLTVILGNATIARQTPRDDRELDEQLRLVEAAATRAAELCRQLLAYAGRGRAGVRPVDFNSVVRESIDLVRTSCSKNCVLWLELDNGLPAVRGDATQLQQVVMNLLINATEAVGAAHGRVQVRTGVRHHTAAELAAWPVAGDVAPGEFIVVEVRDTGCGMSPETKARIFEPFFTTKYSGRGIGLATVAGIVRGHQGALDVESTVGQGTCFRLLLPVTPPAAANTPEPVAAPETARAEPNQALAKPARARTALVVDDEPMIRDIARGVLGHEGFEVLSAPDADTGLALLCVHNGPLDVVVLDYALPGLDAEAAFDEFRKIDSRVPILLTSGFSEEEATRNFGDRVIAGFLQKPFTASALVAAVNRALDAAHP